MTHYGPPQDGQPYSGPPPGQAYNSPPIPHTPAQHETHRPGQGLAITAFVFGVVAVVVALTLVRIAAPAVGLVAIVLGIVALVGKSHGGKRLAAGALGLGLATIPLAVVLTMVAQANQRANDSEVDRMVACMTESPNGSLECINNE